MTKAVRFRQSDEIKYGLLEGSKIYQITGCYLQTLEKTGDTFDLDQVELLSPCEPSKIICVGLNYPLEGNETKIPETPLLFMKPPTSIIGSNQTIIKWPEINELVFEGELAVVTSKKAHCIQIDQALDYVFGYTIANDVTARDLQRVDSQWTRAKSFDTFLPLGPYIVTDINWDNLHIQTLLNGKIMQEGNTQQMLFSVPYLISYISHIMTLLPGDVILTGTPTGYGGLMNPDDVVEIKIDQIGELINNVGFSNMIGK